MLSSSPRDNWERLVAAVIKREQIWQLCHQDSITTAATSSHTHTPSDSTPEILSISSNRLRQPQHPFTSSSRLELEVRKNGSGTITRKLFSALQKRMKTKDKDSHLSIPEERVRTFSLHTLQFATDNFHNNNIIGRGSHGTVYKGCMADGSLVAVKRVTAQRQETRTELEVASITAHRNVLSVRGFCFTENVQLLVFPFMANGSVTWWLRERPEYLPPLKWPVRKQIAVGAAKGLAYLHHECLRKIIHSDIKASNVLLNEEFEAVIADFNLAEFIDCYDDDVVTGVKGTLGHIAPEYFTTPKCSVKADVFGYGVFLLELITAQKSYDLARGNNDDDAMLLYMVKRSYKEGNWRTMVDANLRDKLLDEEVEKLLQIALICTQTEAGRRPKMLEVVRMLEVGYGLAEKWEQWYKDLKDEIMEVGHIRRFSMDEIESATKGFSDKIMSKDGFNMVYKGWLAGSPVAVKRCNSQSLERYFQKEVRIGRIGLHPNLVHVIGICHATEERLLVYHFMPHGNVESWLRGREESRPPLTWQMRRKIALGAAKGLVFLHESKIIHRDIKAANIFLDENFDAAVGDLKLAKMMERNVRSVTTVVRGTLGHIAPEYVATGECSDKTDVYSYGVFLLELITAHIAFDLLSRFRNDQALLINWVKRNFELGNWEGMVDADSGGGFMEAVVEHLVHIALLCTLHSPIERPRMSEVVWMLEDGPIEMYKKEVKCDVYENDYVIEEELSWPR